MAKFLDDCAAYQRYLKEVASGELDLPEYETDANGHVIIVPGEVFCRIPHCPKRRISFSKTINLRVHVQSHNNVNTAPGINGRLSLRGAEVAIQWFNELFSDDENADASDDGQDQKPFAPWKKNLQGLNSQKIRKKAKDLGIAVPCASCKAAGAPANCCKDLDVCSVVSSHFEVEDPQEMERMGLDPCDPDT